MKVERNNGIIQADGVVAALRKMTVPQISDIYVTTFRNGRENGYWLWITKAAKTYSLTTLHVAVAECRGSDQIILMFEDSPPPYPDCPISEDAYRNAHYVDCKQYQLAADVIVAEAKRYFRTGKLTRKGTFTNHRRKSA